MLRYQNVNPTAASVDRSRTSKEPIDRQDVQRALAALVRSIRRLYSSFCRGGRPRRLVTTGVGAAVAVLSQPDGRPRRGLPAGSSTRMASSKRFRSVCSPSNSCLCPWVFKISDQGDGKRSFVNYGSVGYDKAALRGWNGKEPQCSSTTGPKGVIPYGP